MKATRILPVSFLLLLPETAYAQSVSVWLAAAALSPILVIVLTIVLGIITRSWGIGIMHMCLVFLWVLLFIIASRTVEDDYIIWAPVFLYAVHSFLIIFLIVVNITKRGGASSGVK